MNLVYNRQEWLKNNWHKRFGLIVTISFSIFSFFASIKFDLQTVKGNLLYWGLFILAQFLIIILWTVSRNSRKCPLNKIGIVFAIQEKDQRRYEELQYNLINPIKEGLNPKIFHFQTLTYDLCKEVTNPESASKCLDETNSEMIIFGKCKEGKRGNEDKFEIYLHCMIRHAPLDPKVQEKLQEELTELIPRVSLNKKDELTNYELTAQWLNYYSRYFAGVAEAISRNLKRSEEIFLEVKTELDKLKKTIKPIAFIKKRINDNLYGIYLDKLNYFYEKFRNEKDMACLEESHRYLEFLNAVIPNTQLYHSSKATHVFLLERDVKQAFTHLQKVRVKDPGKYFSLAFLNAYEGKLIQALRFYKKAFKLPQTNALAIEVEEFIDYILAKEPEKYHLHLCLALINHFKEDYILAKRDLEMFLQLAGDSKEYAAIVADLSNKIDLAFSEVAASEVAE